LFYFFSSVSWTILRSWRSLAYHNRRSSSTGLSTIRRQRCCRHPLCICLQGVCPSGRRPNIVSDLTVVLDRHRTTSLLPSSRLWSWSSLPSLSSSSSPVKTNTTIIIIIIVIVINFIILNIYSVGILGPQKINFYKFIRRLLQKH